MVDNRNYVEQILLGMILIDGDIVNNKYFSKLNSTYFHAKSHQTIFKCVESLYQDDKPITLTSLIICMNDKKLIEDNTYTYLVNLTRLVNSSANFEYYVQLLFEYNLKDVLSDANNETDVFTCIDKTNQAIDEFNGIISSLKEVNYADSLDEFIKVLENKAQNDFLSVDILNSIVRLEAGNLCVIAGRPAMGKTAVSIEILRNIIFDNKKVLYFSLEMGTIELNRRLISSISNVPLWKLKKKCYDNVELSIIKEQVSILKALPIKIIDNILDLNGIVSLSKKEQPSVVIIDYLQLISVNTKKQNRENEIATITRTLKLLAKSLNIPIILLAQLNRDVEKRTGNKPQLSDLRESGSVEQDANQVIFLYRPAYYGLTDDGKGNTLSDTLSLIVSKNRDGETGTIDLRFIADVQRVERIEVQNTDFNTPF